MKLSLAIKITLKDYFPKYRSIPYETFVCMINHNNNFISQIKFSNLPENNFIQHNVETINSNIIYNFHILDFSKRSLIGICHLCINFDKIKNLNINDTLTQEGINKLLIDSNTKTLLLALNPYKAAVIPEGPAPITIISYIKFTSI